MSNPDNPHAWGIDNIIEKNISEESPLFLILQELQQNFPNEPLGTLRIRASEVVEKRARSGTISFMYRKWPADFADISLAEGIIRLAYPETWDPESEEQLVAFRKKV